MLMLLMLAVFTSCSGNDQAKEGESEQASTEQASNEESSQAAEEENEPAKEEANNDDASNEEGSGEKILRTNNSSEPSSLDPALAKGTHESWTLQHIFTGLMDYNENGELEPAMAESYDQSDDGLTYTFHLRDGIKWSNGDPVTANDFEFA